MDRMKKRQMNVFLTMSLNNPAEAFLNKRRDGQSVNEVLIHIYRVSVLLFTILTKLFGILKGN